jgi:hypothetical protein
MFTDTIGRDQAVLADCALSLSPQRSRTSTRIVRMAWAIGLIARGSPTRGQLLSNFHQQAG